jgi:E-phenylitaconyl-CoA hydratase
MPLQFDVSEQIATITLDRPEAMNAIDPETGQALQDAWHRIQHDPDIRVAILRATGEKAFCTGADLKKSVPPPGSAAAQVFGGIASPLDLSRLHCDKPLIAAINGYAFGGGLELALMCDIRVASDNALFALPEARIGSIPGAGGTQRLIRAIGRSDAMFLLLTGDRMDAAEALRTGLVSRVVPIAELADVARQIALRIAANAPLSVAAIKRLALQGSDLPLAAGLELERQAFGVLRNSDDRLEGRQAFAEKRIPRFTGQ